MLLALLLLSLFTLVLLGFYVFVAAPRSRTHRRSRLRRVHGV